VVAKGTAKNFFKNNKPGIPGTASRYFESMMESGGGDKLLPKNNLA
jgi:hypothetical protein